MPINRWIDEDVEYLYNGILHNLTKEWNYVICSNTDRPRDYHTKWARHRHISYDITYTWNLKKNDSNELMYQTETDSLTI